MFKKEKLGDIAEIISGARLVVKDGEPTETKTVIKRSSSKIGSLLEYAEEEVPEGINSKFYSKKGDIVISLTGSNDIAKINNEGFIIPMAYAIVRVKDGYNSDFIYHLLKSEIFPSQLNKLIEGGSLRIIKTRHLKEITLPIPSYEKQEEYGELLALMDERITLNLELAELEEKMQKSLINDMIKGE